MSGFDKFQRSEADALIGFTPRSCGDCKYSESEGHPCNVCDGPNGYYTPKPAPHKTEKEKRALPFWYKPSKQDEMCAQCKNSAWSIHLDPNSIGPDEYKILEACLSTHTRSINDDCNALCQHQQKDDE